MENKSEKRHTKVLKMRILKPSGEMTWNQLATLFRDARYRVFRLANLAVSEAYLNFHMWRSGRAAEFSSKKISELNKELRKMLELEEENKTEESLNRFSKDGALPASVTDAMARYKLRAITSKGKWREVIRGKSSLPTFRFDMAIPVRCDKPSQRRLERTETGDVEVDLSICRKPYPRVVLATGKNAMGEGQRAILERLLDNKAQSPEGYRQRCFEIKENKQGQWHLLVTYDFPASKAELNKERVVGVDLGFSCPIYVAINNGHARLGWKQFQPLGNRIRSLQRQTMSRRRRMQRGGSEIISENTARSGHGRKRKLQPTNRLEGKVDRAYTTINHQMSSAVIKFAQNHGAGMIQIENLDGLKEQLTGTFLGQYWRYEELQRFITYKAREAGIEVRKINPQYTSQRCSECGYINSKFTREFRDEYRKKQGKSAKFVCPECFYEADADYNAARNIATIDIEEKIRLSLET